MKKRNLIANTVGLLTCLITVNMNLHAQKSNELPLKEILAKEYIGELPEGSKQYDFMIGEWDVVVEEYDNNGKVVDTAEGIWYAKYLHGGRVFFDDVVLFGPNDKLLPGFPSLRTYDPKKGKWYSMHMAPLVDNAMCRNEGSWENGEMIIRSYCLNRDHSIQGYSKIRFYNITKDSFDYTWHNSPDNEDWTLYVTFKAKRRKIQ